MTVLATEPAMPPQKSCLSASIARESFFFVTVDVSDIAFGVMLLLAYEDGCDCDAFSPS